jgi:6-phosphogluconolactonase
MKPLLFFLAFALGLRSTSAAPEHFYLGTYTHHSLGRGIYQGTLDPATGHLSPLTLAATAPDPGFLALSPNGGTLYAAEEMPEGGSVEAWSRADDGQLTPLNRRSANGKGTCFVSVDPTGRDLLAANYGSGSFVCFRLRPDGAIADQTHFELFSGSGPNPQRQQGSHAHAVYASPDDAFVYVCDLGTDCVWTFNFDAATGKLAMSYPPAGQVAPGSGPRHLVFSPNGRFAYVVSEMACTVTVFARDPATGILTPGQVISTLADDSHAAGTTTAEIALHPNGKWLYVSNRGVNTLAVFSVDSTGGLQLIQSVPAGVQVPRSFALDPMGRWLIAAGQADNRLAVLRIDPDTGKLSATTGSVAAPCPVCVLFAPAPGKP